MIFRISVASIFLLVVFSCGTQAPGGSFFKDGVSFTYPPGWSIIDQKDLEGTGFYLTIKKSGYKKSGLFILTRIDGVLDPHEYVKLLQEKYGDQKLVTGENFQPIRNDAFNEIPCVLSKFKFKILGFAQHTGEVYGFVKEGKTYSILKQEAVDDIQENEKGFELIEATFKVE